MAGSFAAIAFSNRAELAVDRGSARGRPRSTRTRPSPPARRRCPARTGGCPPAAPRRARACPALLHVRAVEPPHVRRREDRRHRPDRRERRPELLEQAVRRALRVPRGLVGVVREDVPAAEAEVVERRERHQLANEGRPLLGPLPEADRRPSASASRSASRARGGRPRRRRSGWSRRRRGPAPGRRAGRRPARWSVAFSRVEPPGAPARPKVSDSAPRRKDRRESFEDLRRGCVAACPGAGTMRPMTHRPCRERPAPAGPVGLLSPPPGARS